MRQAIETKYIGPSNVKGSRVKASCQAKSVTLHWDDRLNVPGNHRLAAITLANKMGWGVCGWIGGGTKNGYVFVQDDDGQYRITEELRV